MGRADEYRAYLQSPAWQGLREIVLQRASGVCETCLAVPATQVHHVRYPKRFADDHPDNLLALCDRCHELNHGIRGDTMNLPAPLETYETLAWSFEGRGRVYDFHLYLVDGAPWIAVEDVQHCLDAEDMKAGAYRPIDYDSHAQRPAVTDRGRQSRLRTLGARVAILADRYRRYDSGRCIVRCSGMMQILMQWETPAGQAFREQLGDMLEQQVVDGYKKLKAIEASGSDVATLSDLEVLTRVVGALNRQDKDIAATKADVAEIKQAIAINLDPDEFITVRDGCAERHKDPTQLPKPGHGWNLEQHVGKALHDQGAEPGPKRQQRLSDQGLVRDANTWRRRDVHAAIAAVLGRSLQSVAA